MRYGFHVSTTCKMAIISFSYVDLPKFLSHNCLLIKVRGLLSWVRITPKVFPKVSHSRTKALVKSRTMWTGVEGVESLFHCIILGKSIFL